MKFIRKKAKPAGIGSICTLNKSVIDNIRKTGYYDRNSAMANKGEHGTLYSSNLRKNLIGNNKVLLADSSLLFVHSESVFKNGIVKVIPISIKGDNLNGPGVRSIIDKNNYFLTSIKSLSLASRDLIVNQRERYSYAVQNYIKNCIIDEEKYNKPNFSWEGS
tara:strand:- start:165 stop:650 length:486 start_codon:yes stop_codon:yes gene_type:complete